MKQYLDLLRHVLEHGTEKADRTGTGTRSVFGWQMRFDLDRGLPAGHHQEAAPALDRARAAVVPAGRNQHRLPEGQQGRHLGRMGRRERRARPGLRQAVAPLGRQPTAARSTRSRWVVEEIKRNPDSRRLIVSAWNVADLPQMALMPCHTLFQFYVAERQAQLPAVPAQRRHLPGRAVQHRQLCAADAHGGAGLRAGRGRFRAHAGRCAPVLEPLRAGARTADAHAARAAAAAA